MLTDMRDVLPQIYENVQANKQLIEGAGGSATVAELDWNDPDDEVGWVAVVPEMLMQSMQTGASKQGIAKHVSLHTELESQQAPGAAEAEYVRVLVSAPMVT